MGILNFQMARRSTLNMDYDPSFTRTDLSSKDILMDGGMPMSNGHVCEHDEDDDDDESHDRKGKTVILELTCQYTSCLPCL